MVHDPFDLSPLPPEVVEVARTSLEEARSEFDHVVLPVMVEGFQITAYNPGYLAFAEGVPTYMRPAELVARFDAIAGDGVSFLVGNPNKGAFVKIEDRRAHDPFDLSPLPFEVRNEAQRMLDLAKEIIPPVSKALMGWFLDPFTLQAHYSFEGNPKRMVPKRMKPAEMAALFRAFLHDGFSFLLGNPADMDAFVRIRPLIFPVRHRGRLKGPWQLLGQAEIGRDPFDLSQAPPDVPIQAGRAQGASVSMSLGQVREKYRVPLEQGERIAELVRHDIELFAEALVLVGSIRRKRPAIADVEFVALPKDLDEFDKAARAMGFEAGGKRRKYTGIVEGIKVELYVAHKPEEMGAMTLTYIGDYLFNIAMRSKAKRMGYKLDQYGIWKGKKAALQSPDEREFFDFVGMDWHWPEERSLAARSELEKIIRGLFAPGMRLSKEDAVFVAVAGERLRTEKFLPPEDEGRIRELHRKAYGRTAPAMGAEELLELGQDGSLDDEAPTFPYEDPQGIWQTLYERSTGHSGTVVAFVVRRTGQAEVQIWVEAEEDGRPAYYVAYTGSVAEEELDLPPADFLTGFATWAVETDEPLHWLGPFMSMPEAV